MIAGCDRSTAPPQEQAPDPDPLVEGTAPTTDTACFDGVDGDSDGLIDCEDGDCFTACAEDCADGFDNDDDGWIDCMDDDCAIQSPCNATVRVLGGRLTNAEFAALRCGVTGKRCETCRGIPCVGSTPWP